MRLSLARRARTRWCLATVCLLAAGGCGGGGAPTAPTPVPPPTDPLDEEPQFITYEGSVFVPRGEDYYDGSWGQNGRKGIPGARVTITGGQVDGWTATTDAEGGSRSRTTRSARSNRPSAACACFAWRRRDT